MNRKKERKKERKTERKKERKKFKVHVIKVTQRFYPKMIEIKDCDLLEMIYEIRNSHANSSVRLYVGRAVL